MTILVAAAKICIANFDGTDRDNESGRTVNLPIAPSSASPTFAIIICECHYHTYCASASGMRALFLRCCLWLYSVL